MRIKVLFLLINIIIFTYSVKVQQDDPYKILNVRKNADDATIKKAFKKLSMKYHPDKNDDPAAQQYYAKITNAYETLKDKQKRQDYDYQAKYGHQGGPNYHHHQQGSRGRAHRDDFGGFHFSFGNGGRSKQANFQEYQREFNKKYRGSDDNQEQDTGRRRRGKQQQQESKGFLGQIFGGSLSTGLIVFFGFMFLMNLVKGNQQQQRR